MYSGELGIWFKVFSLVLVFFQVSYINRLAGINHLSFSSSLFPGVFYLVILSIVPDIHPMSSMLLGTTFVVIALFHLFQIIHRNQRSKRIFNTGFFLSIAVLFDLNFIYFVPFFILAANTLIVVRYRDIMLFTLGFLSTVYFLWSYWFVTDQLTDGWQFIWDNMVLFHFDFMYQNYGIIKVGVIGLIVLFILSTFSTLITKTNVFVRNKLLFIFYLMIYGVGVFGLTFYTRLEELLLIILPASILLGLYALSLKKVNIAESLHFLLLIAAFLFQYFLQ